MIDREQKNEYDSYNNNQNDYYGNTHKNINGKFEFQFGAIWTGFMAVFTILAIFGGAGVNLIAIPILGLFWYIGIYVLKNGLKKMKADIATENFGEECFGRIYELSSAGSTNGNTFYRANIIAYLPNEGIVKTFQEDIGYNFYEFPEGSYVRLKYFQDDVNIIEIANENIIPEKVKSKLVIPEKRNEVDGVSNDFYSASDEKAMKTANKIIGIFLLIFGFIWTSVTALGSIATFFAFGGNLLEMIFEIIFFGIFWIVGIGTTIGGLYFCFRKVKKVDTEYNINQEEYESYKPETFNKYENLNIEEEDSDDFDPIQKL